MRIARKPHGTTIPIADLRQALDPMLEKVERSVHSTWSGGGQRVDSYDVRWMCAQLQRETGDQLCSPWPAPDRPDPAARWLWQLYSPELTRAVLTEVLRAAVTGYRDLVEENFAGFGWALGLNSVLPVGVEGTVIMPEDDNDGEHSSLHYELKPSRQAASHVDLDLVTQPEPGSEPGSPPHQMTGGELRSTFRPRTTHRSRQDSPGPRRTSPTSGSPLTCALSAGSTTPSPSTTDRPRSAAAASKLKCAPGCHASLPGSPARPGLPPS